MGTEGKNTGSQERVSDEQLFAVLRGAKKEDGVPALVTSQINEIGDFGYSSTALNSRLRDLHEEGILGHNKAANRHIWWLANEGTAEEVDLSSLEELVSVENLDPERFSEEKAEEIASENIEDFKDNWWQRQSRNGDFLLRIGMLVFLVSLGVEVANLGVSSLLLGFAIIFSLGFTGGAAASYIIGFLGNVGVKMGWVSEEPWNGKSPFSYTLMKLRSESGQQE
jgi:hypothetical protein